MRLLMSNKTLWASNEHQTSLLKWRLLDLKARPAPQCQQLLWSFIWVVPASAVTGTCLLVVCPGKGGELFAKSLRLSLYSSAGCTLLCHPFRPLWQLSTILHAWLAVVRPQIYQPSSLACLLPLERGCSVSEICDFLLALNTFTISWLISTKWWKQQFQGGLKLPSRPGNLWVVVTHSGIVKPFPVIDRVLD